MKFCIFLIFLHLFLQVFCVLTSIFYILRVGCVFFVSFRRYFACISRVFCVFLSSSFGRFCVEFFPKDLSIRSVVEAQSNYS